jgi:hypothetical protein
MIDHCGQVLKTPFLKKIGDLSIKPFSKEIFEEFSKF